MNYSTDYITEEIVKNTKYKSVVDAYDRCYFSVIRDGNVFYTEGSGCSDRTYNLVIKETKRLFPNLTYLYDLQKRRRA